MLTPTQSPPSHQSVSQSVQSVSQSVSQGAVCVQGSQIQTKFKCREDTRTLLINPDVEADKITTPPPPGIHLGMDYDGNHGARHNPPPPPRPPTVTAALCLPLLKLTSLF